MSTNVVTCLTDPCVPPGRWPFNNQPAFWPRITSSFLVPSACKSFTLYGSLELLSICLMRYCLIHEPLNKVSKIFAFPQMNFFFFFNTSKSLCKCLPLFLKPHLAGIPLIIALEASRFLSKGKWLPAASGALLQTHPTCLHWRLRGVLWQKWFTTLPPAPAPQMSD